MKILLIVVTIITIQFVSLGFAQEEVKENEPTKPECGDFWACFNAAAMAFGQRDYAGAIALFTRAAELGDDNQKSVCKTNIGNAWYNKGLALSQAGNYEDAIKAFNSALDNGLNTIDVYMHRGYANLFFEKYQLAIMDFETIIEVMPDNQRAGYLYNVAVVYLRPELMKDEVEKWFKEHAVTGLRPPIYKQNVCPRFIRDEYVSNIRIGNSTVTIRHPAPLATSNFMGCDNYKLKYINSEYIQGVRKKDFNDITFHFPSKNEAVFFARESYETAYYPVERGDLKYQLSSPEAYTMRGKAFLQAKKYDKAIEDFDGAIAMSPNSPEAYLHRASAYEQTGQPQLAVDDLNKYLDLSLFLEDAEKQEILQRIETLKSAAEE